MGPLLRVLLVRRALDRVSGNKDLNRFIRYSAVSVVGVAIAESVILLCTWAFGLSGIVANTIACFVGTPVSYQLNRKWAWGLSGRSHLWSEIVPFWTLTIAGFLASTGTTQWADSVTHSHNITGALRSLAIIGASLFGWGVIWVIKFLIFNRFVFVTHEVGDEQRPQHVGHDPTLAASGPGQRNHGAPFPGKARQPE